MSNVRRFFRYDVDIPLYFEPAAKYDAYPSDVKQPRLLKKTEERHLDALEAGIRVLLKEAFAPESDALRIFFILNHRVDYMAWLLDDIMEGQDPRQRHDFKFRLREDLKLKLPEVSRVSKVGSLIEGFYRQVGDHIHELLESVNNSIHGKIFLFPRQTRDLFSASHYVRNLEDLADRGVMPAKVLRLLIQKLNVYETVFARLKEAYHAIADPSHWPVRSVNLSAGGFSFISPEPYEIFSHLNVFMQLENQVLVCRGKVVLNKAIKRKDSPETYKVGVEFEFLGQAHARIITLFEQKRELRDAMRLAQEHQVVLSG